MVQASKSEQPAAPVPEDGTLDNLTDAAKGCRACPLWERATQTVFGRGPTGSRVMLVGEQPGDSEDRFGEPFVGPAGRLLDQALKRAGFDREAIYVTNAVKHFKWEPRGKRRLHSKPNRGEIEACRPWLDAEIRAVRPRVIVCLGATAAQALLGKELRVTRDRGKAIPSPLAPYVMATVHPSSLLRSPDEETRRREMERFVDDLKKARAYAAAPAEPAPSPASAPPRPAGRKSSQAAGRSSTLVQPGSRRSKAL
ncbi:UdgX family uracil-DNA binding protein [Pendulispora albinea]|uniref:Type-4 uracil-DNA glycosylase n=1 Tax=Pendulispora albinea TaxID=2741071 RepID=A0ABZ2LMC9_9BACT